MHDMQSSIGITFHSFEPEPSFNDYMQSSKQRPDFWNNLGSSKSQTRAQEQKAKVLVTQIVYDSSQDSIRLHRRLM